MTTTNSTGSSTSSITSLLNALGAGSSSSGTGSTTDTTGTGSSSSGTLSAAGIGSGLDVNSIVTALVNAKKAASQNQIDSKTNEIKGQLSSLSSLNSALTTLQAALAKLTTTSTFASFDATATDSSIATATTLSNAVPGSYDLDVTQLATAQKRSSSTLSSTAAVGEGTLSIGVGSKSFNVSVSSTATLADIASSINKASDNPGVVATVINGVNGTQLQLSSSKTGVANAFTISANATSSDGLTALANQLGTPGKFEAQDAKLSLDGIDITSASNNVTGALNGVTIALTKTGDTTLNVTQDNSAATTAVQGFVDAYNAYNTAVQQLDYDPSTKAVGALFGDTTMTSVERSVSSVLSGAVSGNSIGTLASLGITRGDDGTMTSDPDKLSAALTADPSAVQDLFAGTNGYATKLNAALDTYTSSTGIIATRTTSLNNNLTQLGTQQTALDTRMAQYQDQLQKQYTNLDTLMSSLNNTSSYLTTALAQLENSGNSK
jgi:flagellar hook-associated protein 2